MNLHSKSLNDDNFDLFNLLEFFDRCGLTFTLNHVLRPELCKFIHSLCGKSQEPNYAPLKRDIAMVILATVPCKMIAQVETPPLKNCLDISFMLFIEVAL